MSPPSSLLVSFFLVLLYKLVSVDAGIMATCQTDKSSVLGRFVGDAKLLNGSMHSLQKSNYKEFDQDQFTNKVRSFNLPSELETLLLSNLNESTLKDSSLLATALINILQIRCQDLNNEFSTIPADIPLEIYNSSSYRTDKILKIIPDQSSNVVIFSVFGLVAISAIGAFYFVFITKRESISI